MDSSRPARSEGPDLHNATVKLESGTDVSRAISDSLYTLPALQPRSDHPVKQEQEDGGAPAVAEKEVVEPAENVETDYLERLCNDENLDVLEAGVDVSNVLLDNLKRALEHFQSEDAAAIRRSLDDLKARTAPTRTVVGVVGNTGAGKSSVINALLDEERLLPTNCLRACTASPTEISYNYSDEPSEKYRAEVEFITADDWIRELEILFSDLLDGNGEVSREATNPDTDAGVAYAKVKAVYPSTTREDLARVSPGQLANARSVRHILGQVKSIKEDNAKDLYSRLQRYVDSNEKSSQSDYRNKNIPMEYWPLVKVVRIYTKADALSTGAVIVDLPGVQDQNAARAAVAQNYMKSCTGLWIVAPITRAVDDKTAKSLLGDTFKRQLKYDGTYSAVSFICSKTDEISVTEALESLGLDEETHESYAKVEEFREGQRYLKSKVLDTKEKLAALNQQLEECDTSREDFEMLLDKVEDGQTVYAPSNKSKKRKRTGKPSESRKNRVSSDFSDTDEVSDSDVSDKENSQPDENRIPLTAKEIELKLEFLKAERKRIREELRPLKHRIAEMRGEIRNAKSEEESILAEIKSKCIQGRNTYSRDAIKNDFANGIRELDQENAAEEDDENFDPEVDIRDYDKVAGDLPVFCVSSRAYQSLCGRLQKDDFKSDGFLSLEDSEIPKLQAHAKKLTEAGRASHCRRLLNDLTQLVNSTKLWCSNDGTPSLLTNAEKKREQQHLKQLLDQLQEGFESAVKSAITAIETALDDHVYQAFNNTIPTAVGAAADTAAGWGAHRNAGGLLWATYKATVRRDGAYHGASGDRNFNEELFDPISRKVSTGWERAFQRRLPSILQGFAKDTKTALHSFQKSVQARASQRHTNAASMLTLSQQILAHMRSLEALPDAIKASITDLQREASREFTPIIVNVMKRAYEDCTNERGPGSFARMKYIMTSHVDNNKQVMFRLATDTVKERLQRMCKQVQIQMEGQADDTYDSVYREFTETLLGVRVDRRHKLSVHEREQRRKLKELLVEGDRMFASVLDETLPEDEDEMDRDHMSGEEVEGDQMDGLDFGNGEEAGNGEESGNEEPAGTMPQDRGEAVEQAVSVKPDPEGDQATAGPRDVPATRGESDGLLCSERSTAVAGPSEARSTAAATTVSDVTAASQADELMQSAIRDQNLTETKPKGIDSEDEVPPVEALVKGGR
ncbi:Dynamin family-domain-containing protein [Xylariomycetidae sp. FL0641]|nr:Dynamin family-domain-containing protein [Xylariomycetidae sp. FL0641]